MAKQYVFTFSESKKLVVFKNEKDETSEEKTIRKLEKAVLFNLFSIACDSQKTTTKAFECKDCMDAIDNLEDGKNIEFTKTDIEYMDKAFEKTVDQRPAWWFNNCSSILRQLDKPVEKIDKPQDKVSDNPTKQ